MNNWYYLLFFVILLALTRLYFYTARRYNIVDLPNHRTMHEGATIRGGGIIILAGILLFAIWTGFPSFYFLLGLVMIGLTGFLDDLKDLPGGARLIVQIISMLLMVAELDMFGHNVVIIILTVVIGAGILNAYNFMDGINGITGGYSMITVLSLMYVNLFIQPFIPNEFLLSFLISLVVFNIYNFRKNAVCFAGDVGSLSIAFIVIFLIFKLILESQQLIYLFFLTLYGIDTIFTIVQRLARKENIFEAHRLHLFQVAVRKTGLPHLMMSSIYMVVQLLVNIVVVFLATMIYADQMLYGGLLLLLASLVYVSLKSKMLSDLS